MLIMTTATKNIIHKLETLPENMVNEVEDFIDFLQAKHVKSFPESESEKIKLLKSQKAYMVLQKAQFFTFLMILMIH